MLRKTASPLWKGLNCRPFPAHAGLAIQNNLLHFTRPANYR